jgi:hypothetical protein
MDDSSPVDRRACLLLAATLPTSRLEFVAALGRGLVLATVICGAVIVWFAKQLGYAHATHRLVVFDENCLSSVGSALSWTGRRGSCSLVFSLASFFLSVRSLCTDQKAAEWSPLISCNSMQ